MHRNIATHIELFNPRMKLMLIVREPIERMLSHLVQLNPTASWDEIQSQVITFNNGTYNIHEDAKPVLYSNYNKYVNIGNGATDLYTGDRAFQHNVS